MFGARQVQKFLDDQLNDSVDPSERIQVRRRGFLVEIPEWEDGFNYWPRVWLVVFGPLAYGRNIIGQRRVGGAREIAQWILDF